MNILFTVEFYYPHLGGAESVVQHIAESMARKGHNVIVATSVCQERTSVFLNNVYIKEFDIKGNQVKGIRGQIEEYRTYLKRAEFDILVNYAAQTWATDLTLKILDFIDAKKVIIPCGYSGMTIPTKKIPYFFYYKHLHKYLKKYQHIIYHTNTGKDKKYGEKYKLNHWTTIPNGVCIEEFKSTNLDFKKKYSIQTNYLIVSISNHYMIKNHAAMIRAVKQMYNIDFTFIIIGGGNRDGQSCYKRCKKMEKKLGGRLKLFNKLTREETVAALMQADLLLFSSKFEYFPIVLLEAMAAKTPFVSTDVGNARELAGGIIINSTKEMSTAIENLLNNPERMKELGQNGYEQCILNYSWSTISNRYEALFEKLTS